jgi:hypothetical protein
MNALTIGWAFAFAAASCALAVLWFVRQIWRMLRAVEVQLDGLGETHRASSELMSIDIEKAQSARERTRKELTDEILLRDQRDRSRWPDVDHKRRSREHARRKFNDNVAEGGIEG